VNATNVVNISEYPRRDWTKAEHALLMRALKILDARGKCHFPEYFTDDQQNPIVAFTAGYHVDATYSISKVGNRYVVLNYEGRCLADSRTLSAALGKTFYGGMIDPEWFFHHALEIAARVYKERVGTDGVVQA
jgi:hypothetical protein